MRTAALLPLGMVLGFIGLPACGPSPEPVAPSGPVQPKEIAAPPRPTAAPTFDLSPVQEPAGIIAVARWKSPVTTLSNLASCSGMPSDQVESGARALAELILRDLLDANASASELAQSVALDAPIDVVSAMDPAPRPRQPLVAISIGLSSLERARGALEGGAPMTEIAPGMWRIGSGEENDLSCVIAVSAGAAPARIICGPRENDITALGPYLARNVPTMTAPGADMHGELRFAPVTARFGREIQQGLKLLPVGVQSEFAIGDPRFDRALVDAAAAVQDELTALVGEVDRVTLDMVVDPATCLKASGAFELRGKTSWTSGLMADRAAAAGPPPALFWRLPKDSTLAFYGRAGDPSRYTGVMETLRSLVEGALIKANMGTAADRKALVQLLTLRFGKNTSTVQAMGAAAAPPAKPAATTPSSLEAADELVKNMVGWSLTGIDEDAREITKSVKDSVAVYNRQLALAVAYDKAKKREDEKRLAETRRGKIPSAKELEAREKKLGTRSVLTPLVDSLDVDLKFLPTMKLVKAPAALGKDALDVEVTISNIPSPGALAAPPDPDKPAAKKGATLAISMHLLLMPDEKTTWMAAGLNRDELVKRLLSVKNNASPADTLAARPGLEQLKNSKLVSGGFLTMQPVTQAAGATLSFVSSVMGAPQSPVQQMISLLNTMPHRGESPIFLMTDATAGGTSRVEMSFALPKAAMEDLGWLIMGGLNMAANFRP